MNWTSEGYKANELLERAADNLTQHDIRRGEPGWPVFYRRFKKKRDGTVTTEMQDYPGIIGAPHENPDMMYVLGRSGSMYEVSRDSVYDRDPEDNKARKVSLGTENGKLVNYPKIVRYDG